MKVLTAYETRGTVRGLFTRYGHYAVSCYPGAITAMTDPVRIRADFGCESHPVPDGDCEECCDGEPWCHLHGMSAADCPCLGPTEDGVIYDASMEFGARHIDGDPLDLPKETLLQYDLMIAYAPSAVARKLLEFPIPRVCVESDANLFQEMRRPPDQALRPWQFHGTGRQLRYLWLKHLPKLIPAVNAQPSIVKDVGREPAISLGIAEAMVKQWAGTAIR